MMHIITSGFVEEKNKNIFVKQRRMMLMKSQHIKHVCSFEKKEKKKLKQLA